MLPTGNVALFFLWRCNVSKTIKVILSDKDKIVFWGCVLLGLIAGVLS